MAKSSKGSGIQPGKPAPTQQAQSERHGSGTTLKQGQRQGPKSGPLQQGQAREEQQQRQQVQDAGVTSKAKAGGGKKKQR